MRRSAAKLIFNPSPGRLNVDGGYQLLLTVHAADLAGNPYFRESSLVRFRLDGPAKIIAVDNGNLMSNEPDAPMFDSSVSRAGQRIDPICRHERPCRLSG
ncbi:MAG: hypothetical protein LKI80_15915 [Sporolactobacillus sp.]|nr:hypothetical protein [Sporolactobacillus sp.]